MMNKTIKILTLSLALFALPLAVMAQRTVKVSVHEDAASGQVIPKEIYGHFSEHLGTCIYGGLWVGPDSNIPNIDGYRTDVFNALKDLKVPVLRWPGGCFADEYHWRDGIGPAESRPTMINANWGGTVEDNSFGTHEFLNFCEMLGIEPYISGNVGSGTPEEMAQWVQYMTAADGPLAELRAKNGREEPWKVKYLGIGNESWGCGGNMRPEFYSDLYRQFGTYTRNYSGNRLYKVASGASDYDYNWTKVLMENIGNRMHGLSLHYYTVLNWGRKGSATQFTDQDYLATLGKAVEVDTVITRHKAIMDQYDPNKRIDLLLDEWGTWYDEEPGTVRGHLYQQNTMRDAIVAALSFNIFHRHTDRLKMANIAQIANVLQSMVLTRGDKMVLTPTYHVFKLYNVHQDAEFLPTDCDSDLLDAGSGRKVERVSATASRDADGVIHVSLVNTGLEEDVIVSLDFDKNVSGMIEGQILTSSDIRDFNDFDKPDVVRPEVFKDFKIAKGDLEVRLPIKSILSLAIRPAAK